MATRSLGQLTLDLIARIGGFRQGMDQAARIAEDRSRRISNTMRTMQRAVLGVFAAIGGTALIRKMVEETSQAETAMAELADAVKTTGGVAGFTADELANFATELQSATRFGDEAIIGLQTRLLGFTNITGENLTRTTELALDLATAFKTDVASAAKLLGTALQAPERGLTRLRRYGIDLEEGQEKLIKRLAETGRTAEAQKILLDELSAVYGGRARASADTFGGALDQLKNQWGELFEATEDGADAGKEAIQELTETLKDPEIKEGVQALTSGILGFLGTFVSVLAQVALGIKDLGEELAAAFSGPAIDDIPRLTSELARLRAAAKFGADVGEETKRIEEMIALSKNIVPEIDKLAQRAAALNRAGLFPTDQLKEYLTFLKEIRDQHVTMPPISGTGVTTGDGVAPPAPPSEEFTKLADKLREQIELYGKVGEAAKISYQIQSGQLDDLTDAEQDQVLALASQYDALVRAAEAAKALEAEQKKLKDAFDSQVDSLTRQIALVDALTEVERVRYEVTKGNLKDLTQAQKDQLLSLASSVDESAAAKSLEQINLKLLELKGNTTEAIKIRFELDNAELIRQLNQTGNEAGLATVESLRQMTISQAEFNELREEASRITENLAIQEERIRNSQETGAVTELEALAEIGEARSEAAADLNTILESMQAIAAESGNPELIRNVEVFRNEIDKLEAQTNLLAQRLESDLKDSFSSVFADVITGAKSAKDAVSAFIDDMFQRLASLAAQNFAEKIFGSLSSGGGGPLGSFATFLFGGSRDSGGRGAPGEAVLIGTGAQPELFIPDTPGSFVPNADQMGMKQENHFSFSITAPGGRVSRATEQQVAAAAMRGLAEANRRSN